MLGKAAKGGIEFATQAVLDATGELAGQVVAGEDIQPGAILSEAIGGVATTPVEMAVGATTFNKSPQQIVDEQTQEINPTDQSALDRKAEAIQAKAEKSEEALAAGNTDIQSPVIPNDQETQTTPPAAVEQPTVPETQTQEEVQVQTDQEVPAPQDTTVTQDVTDVIDENSPKTQYITEEATETQQQP